eukprot:g335.t1
MGKEKNPRYEQYRNKVNEAFGWTPNSVMWTEVYACDAINFISTSFMVHPYTMEHFTEDKDKAGKDKDKDGTGEAKKKKLPALMELANPSRVIPIQEKYVRFNLNDTLTAGQALPMEVDGENENESTAADLETRKATPCRYVPLLRGDRPSGFLLLEDRNPNEPEEFVEPSKKMEDPEPEPPEPFEWIDGVDG